METIMTPIRFIFWGIVLILTIIISAIYLIGGLAICYISMPVAWLYDQIVKLLHKLTIL
jgi:hypothetical protein